MCNWGQHHTITPTMTLLHELAHAWSFEYMTPKDQQAFVEERELDDWIINVSWWHRGQEQAAEIIAWGLTDGSRQTFYLDGQPFSDLASAFEMLTGTAPLHSATDSCSV